MNVFTASGRVGANAEMKYFESGTNVARFSLAVSRRARSGKDETDWFQCEAWGKTAELVINHAPKGREIMVSGSIELEKYTDKSGVGRTKTTVKVSQVTLLGTKPEATNIVSEEDIAF